MRLLRLRLIWMGVYLLLGISAYAITGLVNLIGQEASSAQATAVEKLLTPIPVPEYVPATSAPPKRLLIYAQVASVSIRSGPGTQYGVVGYLLQCHPGVLLEDGADWTRIGVGSLSGYVSNTFVSLVPPKVAC